MNIRLLLVDDHRLVREGLLRTISTDSAVQIVGEAADGAQGIEMARQLRPDVVLMDIQLPVLNGIEATKQITKELPDVNVLILSMYKEGRFPVAALRAGALGYLHKDDDSESLLKAIRSVAAGEAFLTPLLAKQVLTKLHRRRVNGSVQPIDPTDQLTEREMDLLRLVAQGLSNKEIAQELSLSDSRVRNQLSELYRKIQVKGRAQAAAYAVEQMLA